MKAVGHLLPGVPLSEYPPSHWSHFNPPPLGACREGLMNLHGVTCVDERVVTYVKGGEVLSSQVGDPISQLTVPIGDKVIFFTVQSVKG